jgi:hypothetical protein
MGSEMPYKLSMIEELIVVTWAVWVLVNYLKPRKKLKGG